MVEVMAAESVPADGAREESTPRTGDGARPVGSGFASGEVFDTCLPGPILAGAADKAAGAARDFAGLDDDELIGALRAFDKIEAWAGAGKAAASAELIRRRPAPGRSHATRAGKPAPWDSFCADELAVALAISRNAADRALALAHDLAVRLPQTSRALGEGVLSWYKAQVIAESTRVLNDAGAAAAEALVVPDLAGKTPAQIRAAIGRAVLTADPEAARKRREEALKDARVELWREDAGTAALCGFHLPPNEALAADQAITALALDLKTAGCPGAMDQLRVRAYLDILLGKDTRQSLQQQPAAPSPAHPHTGTRAGQDDRGNGTAPASPGQNDRSNGTAPASPPARPAGPAATLNLTMAKRSSYARYRGY